MTKFTPDKYQKQAIEHDINKPLLVTAGPGSGKTYTITERIKFLLGQNVKQSEILCLTFSKKAAETMQERLEKDGVDTIDMQIGTFHSFCMNVLADNVYDTGIGLHAGIIDRAGLVVWALENIDSFNFDQHITLGNNHVEVIEAMIEGISCFKYEYLTSKQLKDYVDKKLASGKVTAASELEELHRNGNLYKIFSKMEEYLKKQDLISFEDMINYTNQFFERPEKKTHLRIIPK